MQMKPDKTLDLIWIQTVCNLMVLTMHSVASDLIFASLRTILVSSADGLCK